MAKGFFTQGVAILMKKPVSINKIKEVLENDFEIIKINETDNDWAFSGPSLVIPFRPEVNGYVTVDIVDRSWPDDMGDPKEEPILFGAWSMGHFGPCTFPGNLQRAVQQSWTYPEAERAAETHKAFIRVRTTYVLGKIDSNEPILPKDYESLPELIYTLEITKRLLALSESLCYFNPGGECIAPGETIDELLERYSQTGLPPFELIANVRLYNLPQADSWMLMDTVGMLQLDVEDQEAVFYRDAYDPNAVGNFLRNSSYYILQNGPVVKDGDTMDGPGELRWQCASFEDEIASPPRPVLRWFPMDNREMPYGLQEKSENESNQSKEPKTESIETKGKKKGFFSRLVGK